MINVAIVGAGIGREHLAAYQSLPDRFNVSAMCDLDEARSREVTGNDSAICILTDFEQIVSDPDIDLVDICLPPQLHASYVVKVLESGKDAVCEKPMARSLSEADAMRAAMEQSGRRIFPVFQYRYGLGLAQLDALINNKLAGKALVASAETHWNRESDYYSIPWRGTWEYESGGAILSHAIHSHDILTQVLGPVSALSAFTDTRVNPIEVEDCAAISMRMRSGALATSSITLGAASDTSRLRFCFEHLTAESGTLPYAPAQDHWTFTARGASSQEAIDRVLQSVKEPKAGFIGFFEAIANTLAGRRGGEVSFEEGRQSIEFVTAAYCSASQGGKSVELPLSRDNTYFKGWLPD